jgi:hypothetical protein
MRQVEERIGVNHRWVLAVVEVIKIAGGYVMAVSIVGIELKRSFGNK